MKAALGEWLKDTIRAYSASAAITLGALNAGARPFELSRGIVLERIHETDLINGFDPREIVARRVIITLPLDEVNKASDGPYFNLN